MMDLSTSWPALSTSSPFNTTSEEDVYNYWALSLLIFPLVTLFGNLLVVLSVYREKSLHNATNYFIVSLAVADISLAVVVMPIAIWVEVNRGRWQYSAGFCDAWIMFDVMFCTSSIVNLAAISMDRFVAVTQPINYSRHTNVRRVYITITVTWLLSLGLALPLVCGLNASPDRGPNDCRPYNSDYIIYSSITSFYIPAIVMLILYYRIFKVISQRGERAKIQSGRGRIIKNFNAANNCNGDEADKNHNTGTRGCPKIEAMTPLTPNTPNDIITPGTANIDSHHHQMVTYRGLKGQAETCLVMTPHGQSDTNYLMPTQPNQHFVDEGPTSTTDDAIEDDDEQPALGALCALIRPPIATAAVMTLYASNPDAHIIRETQFTTCSPQQINTHNEIPVTSKEERQFTDMDEFRKHLKTRVKMAKNYGKPQSTTSSKCCWKSQTVSSSSVKWPPVEKEKEDPINTFSLSRGMTTLIRMKLPGLDLQRRRERNREKSAARKERKATKTLAIVLGVFLVCWVPFFSLNMLDAVCIKNEQKLFDNKALCNTSPIVMSVAVWLGYINSFLNPIIYTIFNMEFRRAFKKILNIV